MSTIELTSGATAPDVMAALRRFFEARGYLWQAADGDLEATADEGGKPVGPQGVATRLRVAVEVQPERGRVVLGQATRGAAYAGGAGVVFFMVRLNWRFAKLAKAARADLRSAGLAV